MVKGIRAVQTVYVRTRPAEVLQNLRTLARKWAQKRRRYGVGVHGNVAARRIWDDDVVVKVTNFVRMPKIVAQAVARTILHDGRGLTDFSQRTPRDLAVAAVQLLIDATVGTIGVNLKVLARIVNFI